MDARLSSWLTHGLVPGVVAVCDVPVGGAAYDAAGALVGMSVVPFAVFLQMLPVKNFMNLQFFHGAIFARMSDSSSRTY